MYSFNMTLYKLAYAIENAGMKTFYKLVELS